MYKIRVISLVKYLKSLDSNNKDEFKAKTKLVHKITKQT